MTHRIVRIAATALSVVAASSSLACATLSEEPLTRADELVAIVWDPAAKMEHFIRRADFVDVKSSFVFLVPTPSLPVVAVTKGPDTFKELESAYSRLERLVEKAREAEATKGTLGAEPATAGSPPVDVVSRGMVGSYDTAILKSDDPGALAKWLKDNGFKTLPTVEKWLEPYVKRSFYLTAFKHVPSFKTVKAGENPTQVELQDVRMSFKAEKPFYPYREPKGTKTNPGKRWRAYVVAPQPMVPTLSDGTLGGPMPVQPAALRLNSQEVTAIADQLGVPDLKAGGTWYLSPAGEYASGARADKDLTWTPKPAPWPPADLAPLTHEGTTMLRDNRIQILGMLIAASAFFFLFGWWARRKAA